MRLEWLEDILAVAETGSFQQAADRRRLTQSAFSRRIQHIEDQMGVELFDRSRRPVQLHPATAAHSDRMARLAGELAQLVADLRRGQRVALNRITIASQHALTTALTPLILQGLHARQPDVHLRLRSANLDDCFALLLQRKADVALVFRLPGEAHPISASFIETVVIGQDRLVPVIAATARAGLEDRLAAGDLPYIAYPADVFLGRVLDRLILPRVRATATPVPKAESALTLAALEMAAVGVAVAWVPQSLARGRLADGALVDLSDCLPAHGLEVTAVRLFGAAEGIAEAVWQQVVVPH